MDNFQELINKATILTAGTDEQKRKGEEMLRQVAFDARGTRWAEIANEILAASCIFDKPLNRDPELVKYLRRWAEIQGMTDPRIVSLLDELKSRPHIAARLRPDVVKDISKWIEDAMPMVVQTMTDRQLRATRKFIEAVSEIEAYNIDEIKYLRKALFSVQFRDISQEVYTALSNWSIDEAWDLFRSLSNSPSGFQEEINKLQEKIYKVAGARKAVEELLQQPLRQELQKWSEFHALTVSLQKLYEFIEDPQVPESWKHRLTGEAEKGLGAATAFLNRQAVATTSIDDLKSFWTDYKRIITPDYDDKLVPEKEWFQNCLDYVTGVEKSIVAQAETPEELKEIGANLTVEEERIPPFAAEHLRALTDEISHMAKNWNAMQSGFDFSDIASGEARLPVPDRFKSDAPKFRGMLRRVEEALSMMNGGDGFTLEQNLLQAGLVAGEILLQVPGHAIASELKNKVERAVLCFRLDKALVDWDVEKFLLLSEDATTDRDYKRLALNADALHELAALAKQREFQSWHAASDWWRQWRTAGKRLPESVRKVLPDCFEKAVRSQQTARTDQWYAVLGDLKDVRLSAEEYEKVADSLADELVELNLQGYYEELARKAKIAFVAQYLETKQFDKAAEKLETLDPDHSDTIPLRTRLMVERAIERGVSSVAEVLRSEWNNVALAMNDANAVLLNAVRGAWEENDSGALEKLKEVINRVLGAGRVECENLNDLRQWQLWLSVEDAIKSEVSPLSVNQLISYLRDADTSDGTLHKRLKSIVSHWQARGDIKMLAWAYQAFNRIDASIMPVSGDPVEDMAARSDLVADKVLALLQTEADLQLNELKALQEEVAFEENEWNCLNDFLDSLHYPVNRGRRSKKFSNAKEKLDSLIGVLEKLDYLRGADLRQEANRDQLDSIGQALRRQFNGYTIQESLLTQVDRLSPLTELYYLWQRIKEAAEDCGSDAPIHVFSPDSFAKLSRAIRKLVEKFRDADAEDGTMWRAVSEEYCKLVSDKAGILLPKLFPLDLRLLRDRIDYLQAEDSEFSIALEKLRADQPPVPTGGEVDPERHREYLKLIPPKPPGSRKVYRRFHLFASSEVMNTILMQSRPYLPDWVQKYLDEREV